MMGSDFKYADGGEERLEKLFQPGEELHLAEIRKQTSNWELFYHLSPLRANLIRWIDFSKKENVEILEIGAGCGAITEYLVSLGVSVHVTAVEGAPARANIIKLRCRDAGNLEVVNTNFMEYRSDRKFDYVSAIGVLEYSGKYVKGEEPFVEFIRHAASFLKKDGQLIVAIENQLGHKYIAGVPEDHYGKPYEGLCNYPKYNGIRTFDKQTLRDMLIKAGLPGQQWYYPFPDYKLPTLILSETGIIKEKTFDWLPLLKFPTDDPCFKKQPVFNEKEFLRLLVANVDVSVFMNSFLVLASRQEQNASGMLAVKFNTLRETIYRTSKWFLRAPDQSIHVKTTWEGSSKSKEDAYYPGYRNLHNELVDALYLNQLGRAEECFKIWCQVVEARKLTKCSGAEHLFAAFSEKEFYGRIYAGAKEWLDSGCVDLIPRNILVKAGGSDTQVIDLEWQVENPLPVEFVVNRGMYDLMDDLKKLRGGSAYDAEGFWNLPRSLSSRIHPIFNSLPVDSFSTDLVEIWLGNVARGVVPPVRRADVDMVRARLSGVNNSSGDAVKSEGQRSVLKNGAISLLRLLGRSQLIKRIATQIMNG